MKLTHVLVLVFFLSCGVAFAHHSSAMFDAQKEVTVKGTVKEYNFINPHVSVLLLVTDDKAVTTEWSFEAASVRGMAQAGWRRSTLKPGDTVTLIGRPLRTGQPGAQLVRGILADGTVIKSNAGGNY